MTSEWFVSGPLQSKKNFYIPDKKIHLNQMQISKTQNGLTTGVLNRNILATIASEYKNYSEVFVFHQFV